jgi:4-hydroxybenzoate polyprenyltransferase
MNKSLDLSILKLLRIDHWVKNIVIIPGYVLALLILNLNITQANFVALLTSILATLLASSANYLINEVHDKDTDAFHPTKKSRVAVNNPFDIKIILVTYFALISASIIISSFVSQTLTLTIVVFLFFGILYNVPPVRLKDKPFIDIYLESLNNPIRLIVGWVAVDASTLPPVTLILIYLSSGAFLMTAKRISEISLMSKSMDISRISNYRKSFAYYTEARLFFVLQVNFGFSIFLISILTFKYNTNYALFIPFIILIFSLYTMSVIKNDELVTDNPHYIYKDVLYIVIFLLAILVFIISFKTDIALIDWLFNTSELSIFNFLKTNLN